MKRIYSFLFLVFMFINLVQVEFVYALTTDSKPYFYDVTLDKEGQILGDGDTITVTCKFSDMSLNFDVCYVTINAYNSNITFELSYNDSSNVYCGTYVLGETYDNPERACYIMCISSPYEHGVTTYFNETTHPFGEISFIYDNKCKQGIHYPTTTISRFDATCVENGYTEEITCSLCNTVITASTTIYAQGHVYSDSYDASCNLCNATREISGENENSEPESSEPESSKPGNSEPESSESESSKPENSEPESSKPENSEPESSKPESSESESSKPENSESESSKPENSESESSKPESSESENSKPENSESESSKPESSESGSSKPESSESESSKSESSEPESSDSESFKSNSETPTSEFGLFGIIIALSTIFGGGGIYTVLKKLKQK